MKHFKDPLVWLRGLFAALIGGGATSGSSYFAMAGAKAAGVDVPTLNLNALGVIFLAGALTNVMAYLKQSPLPEVEDVETTVTVKQTTTVHTEGTPPAP
jgi:hypothetical protein